MADKILVLYGSYRADRLGIRLADYLVARLAARGAEPELIDAKAVGLPMLDRMYKEYAPGGAPPAMEALAGKIRGADAFVFVAGEYNWGVQPGLKNLTDHFLEEWFWRPAGIASYSRQRISGRRGLNVDSARDLVGDGHGGGVERLGGGIDRRHPGRRRGADRRGRPVVGAGIWAVCG